MALVLRTEKGTRLSWIEMDNNLRYLEEEMTDHDHAYEPVISLKNTAFNQNFAGTGSATTVAKSDHHHNTVYVQLTDSRLTNSRDPNAHDHIWDDLIGDVPFDRIPVGDTDITVAVGNHGHTDYVETTDSRLSDTRDPNTHDHVWDDLIGSIPYYKIPFGETSEHVAAGNHEHDYVHLTDPRLEDSRDPNPHDHIWDDIIGDVPFDRIPVGDTDITVAIGNHEHTGYVENTDSRLTDSRDPNPHDHSFDDITGDYHEAFAKLISNNNQRFYLTNETDIDLAPYKKLSLTLSGSAENEISYLNYPNGSFVLDTWIIPDNLFENYLKKGICNVSFSMNKLADTNSVNVSWEIYERKSNGSEILIGVSHYSDFIETTKIKHNLYLVIENDYILAPSSVIVNKLMLNVSGSDHTSINLYYGFDSVSYFGYPYQLKGDQIEALRGSYDEPSEDNRFVTQQDPIFFNSDFQSIKRLDKDINGIYTKIQYFRLDNSLVRETTLSGGISPNYELRTEKFYDYNGITEVGEINFELIYDGDDLIEKRYIP